MADILEANWTVTLDVLCPKCEKDVDLLDDPEFWMDQEDLKVGQEKENLSVWCPECGEEFVCNTLY